MGTGTKLGSKTPPRAALTAMSLVFLAGSSTSLLGASAEFRLAALPAPSSTGTSTVVPPSQTGFASGATVYLEVWVQTAAAEGLSSASLDVSFNPLRAAAAAITASPIFAELQHGTIDNAVGMIDDLSGSHLGPCTDGVATSPDWVRMAVVELTANADGPLRFDALPSGSAVYGTALCGVGDIDPTDITYRPATVLVGDQSIPAASTWGLIAMGLLLLVAGTLLVNRPLLAGASGGRPDGAP